MQHLKVMLVSRLLLVVFEGCERAGTFTTVEKSRAPDTENRTISSSIVSGSVHGIQTHRQNPGRIVLHGNQNGDQNR
jgi:hypothetical protein